MGWLAPLGDALDARQVDFERRAFSGLAIDPDVAATLFDNAVDRGQAKTGPLSVLLVVKNGSKMLAWVSASIPHPVSLIASIT